jgi:hypothetical protein
MPPESPVHPLVLSVFGTWFNVDTIDYENLKSLVSLGGTVVTELVRRGMTAQEVADQLTTTLSEWTPAIAMAFIDATDVDWLADPVALAKLKLILQEMIKVARTLAGPHEARVSAQAR